MRRLVLLAFAGLVGSVAPSLFSSAQAQVGVEIGPRGPRIYETATGSHATNATNVGVAS